MTIIWWWVLVVGVLVGGEGSGRSYRWCLDDGAGFHNLLLVHLRPWTVEVTHDGRHAGLVAHESGKMDGFLGVIFGETMRRYNQQTVALLLVSTMDRYKRSSEHWARGFSLQG